MILQENLTKPNYRPNVLAIDDTRVFRWLLSNLLERLGCRCITAQDGYAGWQLARTCHPDLIITDLEMPVWSGFELIRSVRQVGDRRIGDIPIIVCSTRSDRIYADHAIELGADAYVTKPIRPSELRIAIANCARKLISR
ncbi:response regulator [Stieleria varia]|uniref:Transcriptional regulatory protein AfsQ1 n=1 Tax=Stieleria varia TaxID=2528005 RepID=A0A5C6AFX4_9BACT|nr:response regulator [Stieleria varia]TWT98350.1 Transcriptional regulatory protein AfsQ1 [Stieleria varia]